MRIKYLPAITMLAAGAIVSIYDILHKVELYTALKRLFMVLIIFYMIGLIAKSVITYTLQNDVNNPSEEETEENKDEQGETEDTQNSSETDKKSR